MADLDLTRGHAAGIARGAAVIAGLTVLSRILGLVRTLVFSQRVGASCGRSPGASLTRGYSSPPGAPIASCSSPVTACPFP
jgi:hypothetical protein